MVYIKNRRWLFSLGALFTAACLAALICGFFALNNAGSTEKVVYYVLSGICMPVLACAFAVLFVKIFRKYAIVADQFGIYDYSAGAGYGFIPWENISKISYRSFMEFKRITDPDMPHLTVELKDKKQFEKNLNAFRKVFYILSFKRVHLSLLCCSGNNAEIFEAIEKLRREYAANNGGSN